MAVQSLTPEVQAVLHQRARRWFTLFVIATMVAVTAALWAWRAGVAANDAQTATNEVAAQLRDERKARQTFECEQLAERGAGLRRILIGIEAKFTSLDPELRKLFDDVLANELAPIDCQKRAEQSP